MNCGCVYSECEGEPAEFCDIRKFKAKKVHKCNECRGNIEIGSVYERMVGKWEGNFETFKTCEHCLSIVKVFFCGVRAVSMIEEDLLMHFKENEISVCCLNGLTKEARRRTIDLIDLSFEK